MDSLGLLIVIVVCAGFVALLLTGKSPDDLVDLLPDEPRAVTDFSERLKLERVREHMLHDQEGGADGAEA
jgi:hypothetical protein